MIYYESYTISKEQAVQEDWQFMACLWSGLQQYMTYQQIDKYNDVALLSIFNIYQYFYQERGEKQLYIYRHTSEFSYCVRI